MSKKTVTLRQSNPAPGCAAESRYTVDRKEAAPTATTILDEEGKRLAEIPGLLTDAQVTAIVRFAERQYEAGVRVGQGRTERALQTALGLDEPLRRLRDRIAEMLQAVLAGQQKIQEQLDALAAGAAGQPDIINTEQAAAEFGCSPAALHVRLSRDPSIPRRKLGSRLQFSRSEIRAWLAAHAERAA